jgi:hypothetical protein
MTRSSTLAVAIVAALALPASGLRAQGAESPPTQAAPAPHTFGPERTDDSGRAVGRRGERDPERAGTDRDRGGEPRGRVFAPDSNPHSPPARRGGSTDAPPDAPRSPPTGDASGGDRRTDASRSRFARVWIADPDLDRPGYPHSVGVADLRRVNDAAGGDGQAPARRLQGAHPPPPPLEEPEAPRASIADRFPKPTPRRVAERAPPLDPAGCARDRRGRGTAADIGRGPLDKREVVAPAASTRADVASFDDESENVRAALTPVSAALLRPLQPEHRSVVGAFGAELPEPRAPDGERNSSA